MLSASHRDDPQMARVVTAQHLLFPSNPRAVCSEMGLNWWAAIKLYEDGWLSFCPEDTARLDEAQEAELRFVGSLVIAGCDRPMLTALLDGLPKPYTYHGDRLYYAWVARKWRLLPEPHSHPEAVFTDWLDTLVEKGDIGSLTGILELAHDALSRVVSKPKPSGIEQLNPFTPLS
jgi:hypothetical protein